MSSNWFFLFCLIAVLIFASAAQFGQDYAVTGKPESYVTVKTGNSTKGFFDWYDNNKNRTSSGTVRVLYAVVNVPMVMSGELFNYSVWYGYENPEKNFDAYFKVPLWVLWLSLVYYSFWVIAFLGVGLWSLFMWCREHKRKKRKRN